MQNKRIAPPEFWRFIIIIFVCILHFEEDVYDKHHLIANSGYLGVDFFFILSGFITAFNHDRRPIASTIEYSMSRIKRLYPDYLFAIILMFLLWLYYDCTGIIDMIKHLNGGKMQFLFLYALFPISLEMRSIWFLSFWLIAIIVLSEILKSNKVWQWGGLAISFISWHYFKIGTLFSGELYPDQFFWSMRMLKCVSEVVLGGVLFGLYKYILRFKLTIPGKIVVTLIELYWISYIFFIMIYRGRNEDDYWVCFGFCVIIVLSFWNQSFISKLLDNHVSIFLGNLSLPIYLYHLFTVRIVSVYYHNYSAKAIVYFGTIFAILLSSFLFHSFVKRYFRDFLNRCFRKLIVRNEDKYDYY